MNASGIRDTARVLHVSPTTVINELKKESELQPVNHVLLAILNPEQIEVEIWRVDELEVHRVELRARRNVEFCRPQDASAMAVARD